MYKKDFKRFAQSKGLSRQFESYFNMINRISASNTPYILEEREMRATQMDVFSRLLKDRIIWLSGTVTPEMCDIVQAQLLYLDSVDKKDITLYINTPGGSVPHGLGIIDVMNYINSDISTVNLGMAASMGSVLLSAGTKGKRAALPYSKVMTHMVSGSFGGNIQDSNISTLEAHKYNYILFKMLARNCDKSFEEMLETSRRDKWYDSRESLKFGFIDEIINDKDSISIDEDFDTYYENEMMKKIR